MGKGVIAYAKANPKMVELVEMVYVEPQPADVTLQLRRVLNAGAELVLVPGSSAAGGGRQARDAGAGQERAADRSACTTR
jgi:hypothetical protein